MECDVEILVIHYFFEVFALLISFEKDGIYLRNLRSTVLNNFASDVLVPERNNTRF